MSIGRRRDKEACIHTHGGILLGHRKERHGVSCSDVDEPRVCHTECSQKKTNGPRILTLTHGEVYAIYQKNGPTERTCGA